MKLEIPPLRAVLGLWLFAAASAGAIGPQDVLLLANEKSPASMETANHYLRLRQIPRENIVFLEVPVTHQITPAQFTELIWEPTWKILRERGLENRILAWVYSAGFPYRVSTSPSVSITGLTFARNQLPDAGIVSTGFYFSAFFRGPGDLDGKRGPPASFDALIEGAGKRSGDFPLPAMMLSYIGPLGLSEDETIDMLKRARRSDGARPSGALYFQTNSDVRTQSRKWQFEDTRSEREKLGLPPANIVSSLPPGATNLLGLLAGRAILDSNPPPGSFAPGGFAEHLTSFAAKFDESSQSKAVVWLRAGAAGTSGTVVEPLSVWTKFPHARFFIHYAAGCTLIESLYQSLACPFQQLPMGDPLAAPFAAPASLIVQADGDGPFKSNIVFRSFVMPAMPPASGFLYAVDAVRMNEQPAGNVVNLKAEMLTDGYHELRVSVRVPGAVRPVYTAVKPFEVSRLGRAVAIDSLEIAGSETSRVVRVKPLATGQPAEFAVFSHGRVLATQKAGPDVLFELPADQLGAGPAEIQVAAGYEDGMVVRGTPRIVDLPRPRSPPPPPAATSASTPPFAAPAATNHVPARIPLKRDPAS